MHFSKSSEVKTKLYANKGQSVINQALFPEWRATRDTRVSMDPGSQVSSVLFWSERTPLYGLLLFLVGTLVPQKTFSTRSGC